VRRSRKSRRGPGPGLSGLRTVIVCDRNPLVRAGVRRTLEVEYGIPVCGETDDGTEAVRLMLEHGAAVLVVEDRLCDQAISDRGLTSGVVILAEDLDAGRLVAFLESGVRAVVCRSGPSQDVVRAVHGAMDGGGFIAPEFAGVVIAALRGSAPGQQGRRAERAGLTVRERAVLDVICKGMTNREIASALSVSEKTVKFHVSNVLAKMEVRNRAQLIANVAGVPPGPEP
jgi:DNA-binding NarL/FixJ family response regulator